MLHKEPGLKAIAQSRGPVRRCLIMAQGAPPRRIDDLIRRFRLCDGRSDLLLHDFDDPGQDERTVAGRVWLRASDDERLLNKATFVVDLAQDDDALLKGMASGHRRDLRKAIEGGLRVEIADPPTAEAFREFVANFERMARERNLRFLDRCATRRMFDCADLTLYRALCGNDLRAEASVYRTGTAALWMVGVDGGVKRQDGAGRLLQFEIMRDLRKRGIRWYDLGGVASTDAADGIFQFKKRFGGQFVALGAEYIHRPALVGAFVSVKRRMSRLRASLQRGNATAPDAGAGVFSREAFTGCKP